MIIVILNRPTGETPRLICLFIRVPVFKWVQSYNKIGHIVYGGAFV